MLSSFALLLALATSTHSDGSHTPAQGNMYNTRFPNTTWDDTNWILKTTTLDQGHYQSRMSLANGYLGINLAAVGPFFDIDTPVNGDQIQGWPLFDRRQSFATIAGFWDEQPTTNGTNFEWLNQYGGESVISGVPHWAGLHVQVEGDLLDAKVPAEQISDFSSSLDIRNARLYWQYTWTPPSCGVPIEVAYIMFVNKLHVNQAAVRLHLTAARDVDVKIVDLLEGDCAVRTQFVEKGSHLNKTIFSAVRPDGIRNVTAYVYSTVGADKESDLRNRRIVRDEKIVGGNHSTIAQSFDVRLTAGQPMNVTKFIGGASSDAFDDPKETAMQASLNGAGNCYSGVICYEIMERKHIAEWMTIMPNSSVDSFRYENGSLPNDINVQELQITAITNPFHLLQNTIGDNAVQAAGNNTKLQTSSISVCGLGSSCYAGLIFWDVEVWMQPGMVVSFPDATTQIARYRVERFPQAQANILTAYQSSQNETGKFSPDGAIYSWTSGRFGNCTGTGPCFDYEYHINGDIGLELYNYWVATGDTKFFKDELFPVYEAIAQMYADLVTFNKTTGRYDLYNATDPDEYANFQTNVGYTMVLMSSHINNTNMIRERFGMEPNETWAKISSLITIPVDEDAGLILEYAAQNGSIQVKQADIVLIDDFLQYENPYTLNDLDYYAAHQSPDGPAMTYGVFAIVANRESPSGCSSYTYDLYGSQPYTRGPWFQFSEQLIDDFSENGGTHPAYPFLTGIGGANRVAVFGYLGLRLDPDTLDIDPSLPPQIPQLEYRTIYWQGWPIKALSNQTHTTLTRLNTSLPNANNTFASAPIPVTISLTGKAIHNLAPNGSLTIPNRRIGLIKTIPNNIAQCQPVTTPTDQSYEPGQFPLSAVDGAVSTKWQPTLSNTSSSLTVSLPQPFLPISGFRFDWAQAPPTSYTVLFHNLSDISRVPPLNVTHEENVVISEPYDAGRAFDIKPYMSNGTNVTLEEVVWSARFATLVVRGNQALRGTGEEGSGTGCSVAEWAVVAVGGEEVGMEVV